MKPELLELRQLYEEHIETLKCDIKDANNRIVNYSMLVNVEKTQIRIISLQVLEYEAKLTALNKKIEE